jgi:hypothetical protein
MYEIKRGWARKNKAQFAPVVAQAVMCRHPVLARSDKDIDGGLDAISATVGPADGSLP